ncbi:MAG: GNAT family N-acetyltransferase [Pseudomonadota bacterium]
MVLTTERLRLRLPQLDDAPFIQKLLNDPDWLRNIGDRGVRNTADAARYIDERLLDSFRRHGFGLWLVESRSGAEPLGLCGLLKRDYLEDLDIGYAFLPGARGQGHAFEAAQRTMRFASQELGHKRVAALVLRENISSVRLLTRLGMSFQREIQDRDSEVDLYLLQLEQQATS